MSFPSVTTIRLRLILLVTLGLLVCSGVLVSHAFLERNRKLAELQNQTVRLAKHTGKEVSQALEGTQQMLRSLASSEAVSTLDVPAASALFAEKLKQSSAYLNISLAQPDGTLLASGLPLTPASRLADRSFILRLQKERAFAVGEYSAAENTGKPSLAVGFTLPPSRPGALPPGIVLASLNLAVLRDCLAKNNLPDSGVAMITDAKGIYLARHPDVDQWVGTKALSWEMMETRGEARIGFIESTGADQIPRIYYYTPVPNSNGSLHVAFGFSHAPVLSAVHAHLVRQLCWLGLAGVMGLIAAWFLGGRYATPLQHADQQTETTRRIAAFLGADLHPEPNAAPQPPENAPELPTQAQPMRQIAAPEVVATLASDGKPFQTGREDSRSTPFTTAHPPMSASPHPAPALPRTDGVAELQHLAQSFETMSTVLKEHNARLERAVKDQAAAVTAIDAAWEQEIARHRQAEMDLKAKRAEQEQVTQQLQEALDHVHSIKGLLPIYTRSEKDRDSQLWNRPGQAPARSAKPGLQSSNGGNFAKKQSPDLKVDLSATPIKLHGFDSGALFFGARKTDAPPSSNP